MKVIGVMIQSPNAFALLNIYPFLRIYPTIPLQLLHKMSHFFSHQCHCLFQSMHLQLLLFLLYFLTPVFPPQFLQMFTTLVLQNHVRVRMLCRPGGSFSTSTSTKFSSRPSSSCSIL